MANYIQEFQGKIKATGADIQGDIKAAEVNIQGSIKASEAELQGNIKALGADIQNTVSAAHIMINKPDFTHDLESYLKRIDADLGQLDNIIHALHKLDEATWESIDSLAKAGLASSLFRVGDEKVVNISGGERLTLVILGFDHDDLEVGGKAKITFGMKNLVSVISYMNGDDSNIGGWEKSTMRTDLMPFLFNVLPADLQKIIKPVNKLTSSGDIEGTKIITSSDNLFLMSEVELRGETVFSMAGEGTQYDYYKGNSADDFIKYLSDGSGEASQWWLRSAASGTNTDFCSISQLGDVLASDSGNQEGICIGFCI